MRLSFFRCRPWVNLSLPFFLLAFAGCSSEDEVPVGGTAETPDGSRLSETKSYDSLESDEICPAFIEDACRAVFQCPELAEVTEYKNEEQCRQDIPCRGLGNFESELAMGHFTWDPKKAASCHDFLNNDLCVAAEELVTRSLQGVLALCPELPTIPAQAAGDLCLSSHACPSGTFCSSEDECGGSCVPSNPAGGRCEVDRDCADGLPCKERHCGEPPQVGEACPDFYCVDGADCEPNELGSDGICVAEVTLSEGEACTGDYDCSGDLNCLQLGQGGGGSVTIGAPEDNGVCSGPVAEGGDCSWSSDCADGLACLEEKCSQKPVLGQTCDSFLFGGHDCAAGFICDEDVCKKARFWEESCDGDDEVCAEGICVEGLCSPRRENGSLCEENNECRFRRCTDGACEDPRSCSE